MLICRGREEQKWYVLVHTYIVQNLGDLPTSLDWKLVPKKSSLIYFVASIMEQYFFFFVDGSGCASTWWW